MSLKGPIAVKAVAWQPDVETADGAVQRLAERAARNRRGGEEAGRAALPRSSYRRLKDLRRADIEPRSQAGHRLFGENRVQEAKGKWPALRDTLSRTSSCTSSARCSRTRRRRPSSCSTPSTPSTGPRSPRPSPTRWQRQGKRLQLFIQVNTGEEPQKAGVMPREPPALAAPCRDELGSRSPA